MSNVVYLRDYRPRAEPSDARLPLGLALFLMAVVGACLWALALSLFFWPAP